MLKDCYIDDMDMIEISLCTEKLHRKFGRMGYFEGIVDCLDINKNGQEAYKLVYELKDLLNCVCEDNV